MLCGTPHLKDVRGAVLAGLTQRRQHLQLVSHLANHVPEVIRANMSEDSPCCCS